MGEPFLLEEWEKDFIRNVYDPTDERGLRRIRRALLSIARKNGKSALSAALVLVHLVGPMAKRNSQIVSAAADRDQAALIYAMAKQMVELDDELGAMCQCFDSTKRIICVHNGSFYKSLSKEARTKHGGNPAFVLYDELAQAPSRELFDVLSTSFGAQEEALLLAISTQSNDPLSVMSEMADDARAQRAGMLDDPHFYGIVYEIPEKADIYDEANWRLANPALGTFRSLTDMRALAAKAKRSPSAEAAFRNLNCNQRVDGAAAFVNSIDWKLCAGDVPDEELLGRPCLVALDLSNRQDLTARAAIFPFPDGRVVVRMRFWLPRGGTADDKPEESLLAREKRDGAQYVQWEKAGHLVTMPGRTVDYQAVAQDLLDLRSKYQVTQVGYDAWRINVFKTELEKLGIALDSFEWKPVAQSFKGMSPAIEVLESLVIEHKLQHGGNPLLTYCVANVKTLVDISENRRFDKRHKHKRIDGAVALAMAVSLIPEKVEEEGRSYLETSKLMVA